MLTVETINTYLSTIPELAQWSNVGDRLREAFDHTSRDWKLPLLTCQAVGGAPEQAAPACIAIAASQMAIIVVDDMLDHEPVGLHHDVGAGEAANIALALQAIALRVVDQADVSAEIKAAVCTRLAQMHLHTAYGQHLDVQNLTGEDAYWRVTAAKSTPFYGCAYEIGALLGGADRATAGALYEIGVLLGELIQVEDDLTDALKTPANADWRAGRNNLLILYAQVADHPERERFGRLRTQIDDPDILQEAQQILQRSGAVSYAFYNMVARNKAIADRLRALPLAQPDVLLNMHTAYGRRLSDTLRANGVELSADTLMATG